MYHVDIANAGDYSFKVKTKGYEFIIDTKGKGAMPPEAFLASIGSCLGVYLRKYADGAKLALPGFDISVEAELSKEDPACFRRINVVIDFKGMQLDEQTLRSMREYLKKCPLHNTLTNNPEIEIKIGK